MKQGPASLKLDNSNCPTRFKVSWYNVYLSSLSYLITCHNSYSLLVSSHIKCRRGGGDSFKVKHLERGREMLRIISNSHFDFTELCREWKALEDAFRPLLITGLSTSHLAMPMVNSHTRHQTILKESNKHNKGAKSKKLYLTNDVWN